MRRRFKGERKLFVLVLLFQAVCSCPVFAAPPERAAAAPMNRQGSPRAWKAGYAEADITPKPGLPVMPAGFGESRIMEGTESPLLAQALALEDADGKRAVLFTSDSLGFGRITIDAVRHKIQAAHGIPAENVCFTASHTHWGPAVNYRTGSAIGDVNIWYLGFLETTLLELADKALKNLKPAEVAYGWCDVRIGMSRRLPSERGIRWAVNPDGSYDRHTPILRVRREGSPRQVVLVGHACHPTSMGNLNRWSADYPGAMRRKLAAALEDGRAMFVNGAGGDAKVVYQDAATGKYEFAASLEKSHQAGVALANAVLTRLGSDQPLEPLDAKLNATLVRGTLSLQAGPSREELMKLALDGSLKSVTTWWARKNLAFPDDRRGFDYAVQSWQLGDLTIVALEGELCADWGAFARSLPATKHSMTIGYANEVSSYIPTARIIREGGYEGDLSHKVYLLPSRFDPRMEVELTALIRRAIAQVSERPSPIAPAQSPQPVTAAVAIRLVERGALLVEDFDAPEMNSKIWRRAHRNPDRTAFDQQSGRLELTARGLVGMNGFWGLSGMKAKDIVLVGEMDIRSTGPQPHRLALHLCGGDGKRSPDHWVEVVMVDLGEKARFSAGAALPEGFDRRQNQSLELPHPPGQGFLCRIELNGVTNLAELWVKATDGWKKVCDPIELPLRTVHAEAKFNGNYGAKPATPEETTSRAWFDNVRIYPRPQSHHVGINLLREDGREIWVREGGGWPPTITDAAGKRRKISDLVVELRTEDGARLVASSQSQNFGFHLLPLKDAPWDVYPVAAQVRVLLDGKPLGKPLRIERADSKGLYPDDVYEVVIQ